MPSESMRNITIDQFRMDPREERGDVERDVLMSERERLR